MIVENNNGNQSPRLSNAWRYVSPSKLKSQDYYEAFELRTKTDGSMESNVSFDVNTNASMSKSVRRSEIYQIYDSKKSFSPSVNGRFIMVDLINAQLEANFSEELLRADIDGKSHCSLYYMNGCYEIKIKRLEVLGILYHNIKDEILTYTDSSNNLTICNN